MSLFDLLTNLAQLFGQRRNHFSDPKQFKPYLYHGHALSTNLMIQMTSHVHKDIIISLGDICLVKIKL